MEIIRKINAIVPKGRKELKSSNKPEKKEKYKAKGKLIKVIKTTEIKNKFKENIV